MRTEYKIVSSISGGINETYTDIKEYRERFNYIYNHKEEFKSNSMIYCYVYLYNEKGKIVSHKTKSIIDLRGKEK